MSTTLLLNASYEPMETIAWSKAVCLWLDGKAEILETYSSRVYTSLRDWNGCMPAVIRLVRYVRYRNQVVFSRANVFARDNKTCQYCGGSFDSRDLTFDHVVPKSKGGTMSWDNITTSCWPCNNRKGDRTPEEAGMPLLSVPTRPGSRAPLLVRRGGSVVPPQWLDYLLGNT